MRKLAPGAVVFSDEKTTHHSVASLAMYGEVKRCAGFFAMAAGKFAFKLT